MCTRQVCSSRSRCKWHRQWSIAVVAFFQVVLSDQGVTPGLITQGDWHGRSLATLQLGDGDGQTPSIAEQGPRH